METKLIYKQIPLIMQGMEAIGKNKKNQQQGFQYRGIDDVYNELHPLLAKHGVFSTTEVLEEKTEERTTKSGSALLYRILKVRFTFFAEDGSSVSCVTIGEGMDSGDKASNKAMSIAHKYALFQLFAIPTEDQPDPDKESHEVKPKKSEPVASKPAQAPQKPIEDQHLKDLAELLEMAVEGGYIDTTMAKQTIDQMNLKTGEDRPAYLAKVKGHLEKKAQEAATGQAEIF